MSLHIEVVVDGWALLVGGGRFILVRSDVY